MPSESMSTTASKSAALQIAIRIGARGPVAYSSSSPPIACGAFQPRSAAPGCRAARPESRAGPARPSEWRAPARRIRSAHRAWSRRSGPSGLAPTQCPDRPTRCSATAMERGEPIWQTRSTVPMSMPSSSEAVATTARSSPFFRRASASSRSAARKAAVMRQHGVFAQPFGQCMRDAFGQPPGVDEDQRGAMRAESAGPRDRRFRPTSRCVATGPSSSRGTSTASSMSRRWPMLTMRSLAGSGIARLLRSGFTVAERPIAAAVPASAVRAPAAPGTAPDASRACRRPRRGFRRRSPSAWFAASRAIFRRSAECRATPAW